MKRTSLPLHRRNLIALLGGAASWPLVARAQQPNPVRRIGALMGIANDADGRSRMAAFLHRLEELGWDQGKVRIEDRWSAGEPDRIRVYVDELLTLKPDVILVNSTLALTILHQQTSAIPIVMIATNDPAGGGFEASLARPSGNVTGFTMFELSLVGKMLGVLKQAAPDILRVALVTGASSPNAAVYLRFLESIASSLGVKASGVSVRDENEIERALSDVAREPNGALLVPPDVFLAAHREAVVALAARHRLPLISPYRLFTTGGSLISYGPDLPDLYRRAASYVDRILKGEMPAALPIQAPTKYELVINLKTAKALGLDVPVSLLAIADEVIE
jgi:putative tryptophan/tyrosine transport system substrate-binding protein